MDNVKEFKRAIRKDKAQLIKKYLIGDVYKNKKSISLKDKFEYVIKDLCSLSITTLEILIPTFNVKYDLGKEVSLYVKAVGCDSKVFGFINSYYNASIRVRIDAYIYACMVGNMSIIKKIRGLEYIHYKHILGIISDLKQVKEEVKEFVKSESRKSRAKKDKSPEDFLKEKQKYSIKKQISISKPEIKSRFTVVSVKKIK